MKVRRALKSALLLSAVLNSFAAFSDDSIPTLQLLSERRSSLTFPRYTIEQKNIVLDQVRLILGEIFVHRELKLKDFGAASDPLPLIDEIGKHVDTISDMDFHKKIGEIFVKQKDFHTGYTFPKPYACYRTLIPISLKEVTDYTGNKVIAVAGVSSDENIMKIMPHPFQIEKGDVVLFYNGIPIRQAIQQAASRSRGANSAAVLRHSANLLTYISQASEVVPENDVTTLVLRNRLGKTYTATLPWVSRVNQDCLKPQDPANNVAGKFSAISLGANEYQNEFNKLFRKKKSHIKSMPGNDQVKDTAEPILKYSFIDNEYGTFGYLSLESFVPEKLSVEGVVLEVKRLLLNQFANVDGLIIDLRDNGGGQITLADSLVQLFTAKNPVPINFKLKNSPANIFYMEKNAPNNPFTMSLKEAARTGATYTDLFPITPASTEEANKIGQSFFKPVAILTNSSCYSSCDMFTAQMQDHGAAIIFGEDANTGAGGANNYNLKGIYNDLPKGDKGPFKQLPGGQTIGFAFRQTVRVGTHAGSLIEDVGVIADTLATPNISDLYNNSEDQFKVITRRLNLDSPKFTSWVKLGENNRSDFGPNQLPKIFAQWEQTTSVEFKDIGKSIGKFAIESDNIAGRELFAPEILRTSEYKIKTIEMSGFDSGKRVWRKILNYRIVPLSFTLPANQNLEVDLSKALPAYWALYTTKGPKSEGWTLQNEALKIGNGSQYANNVHAEASVFIVLPTQALGLNFDAEIMTEENYDFFKVIVVSEGNETVLLNSISGNHPMQQYSFDLSAFAGKKVEVRFVFDSDEGGVDKGVAIQNISIKNLLAPK